MLGACLARTGESVTMVVRPETLEAFPSSLRLESPLLGNFSVKVEKASQVPAADVLWITVKATQLEGALHSIPRGDIVQAIVPLQNGIEHVSHLRQRFGSGRVIGGTIAGEMERIAPGHYVHPSPFAMLNLASAGRELLGNTCEKLQTLGMSCRFMDDEKAMLWLKLVFLGPFALATSAARVPIGEVLGHADRYKELESCIREFCAVATAEGVAVPVDKVIAAFFNVPKDMRSSMQKDVERGNAPELDAIAGPVLRGGNQHRIAVPATTKLVGAIERRSAQLQSG